jgi:hypothetical protein
MVHAYSHHGSIAIPALRLTQSLRIVMLCFSWSLTLRLLTAVFAAGRGSSHTTNLTRLHQLHADAGSAARLA